MKKVRNVLALISALSVAFVGTAFVGTASAGHVSCGDIILEDTTLDSDVGPCTIGLTIGASNVDLDLAGHIVFGGEGDDGPGIYFSNVSGSRVRNGTVTGFETGVYIEFGGINTVSAVRVVDNVSEQHGIFDEGIQIFQSDGNRILNNQVMRNGSGIVAFDADNTLISGNIVQSNNAAIGIGIWLFRLTGGFTTSNNLVLNNIVIDHSLDGIQVAANANNNTVRQNNVSLSARDGIIIFGNGNLFEGNSSNRNAQHGIRVRNPNANFGKNNTLLRNQAFGNGTFDLRDENPNCDNNAWHGNTGLTFTPPCVLNP